MTISKEEALNRISNELLRLENKDRRRINNDHRKGKVYIVKSEEREIYGETVSLYVEINKLSQGEILNKDLENKINEFSQKN